MRDRTSAREQRAHRGALRGLVVSYPPGTGGGPGGLAHARAGGYVQLRHDCYNISSEWIVALCWLRTLDDWRRLWFKLTDYLRRAR